MLTTQRQLQQIQQLTQGQSLASLNMPALPADRQLAGRIGEVAPQFFGAQAAQVQFLAQAYADPRAGATAGNVIGERLQQAIDNASFNGDATVANGAMMFGFAVNAIRERLREGTNA